MRNSPNARQDETACSTSADDPFPGAARLQRLVDLVGDHEPEVAQVGPRAARPRVGTADQKAAALEAMHEVVLLELPAGRAARGRGSSAACRPKALPAARSPRGKCPLAMLARRTRSHEFVPASRSRCAAHSCARTSAVSGLLSIVDDFALSIVYDMRKCRTRKAPKHVIAGAKCAAPQRASCRNVLSRSLIK